VCLKTQTEQHIFKNTFLAKCCTFPHNANGPLCKEAGKTIVEL
jgi:hypothetical protein